MTKKKGKRKLSRTKTYGFNPWLDQIDSINTLMYRNPGVKESVILRKLIDDALEARRHDATKTLSQDVFLMQLGQDIDDIKETLEKMTQVFVSLVERLDGKTPK